MSKKKFELPDERVVVKYIPRNKGVATNVPSNHVMSGGMLINSTRKFVAPLQRNNTVKNVLTDEEKTYLEERTGMNLSVYGDFWADFHVALHKEDNANILDLSQPMDYIKYKILMSLTKVNIAPSWEDRNKNLDYEFAITREDETINYAKREFNIKSEAFKQYGKVEDDREILISILKLLTNRPISKDSTLSWVQAEVGAVVDSEPKRFLSVIEDSGFHTKVMIHKGIDNEYIFKTGNRYSTKDGLDLCEPGEIPTLENAVLFLDNPKNQDIRSLVEAKINKK